MKSIPTQEATAPPIAKMKPDGGGTFWEHLEVLRWTLIRCGIVLLGISIAAFCLKDFIFDDIVLAPCHKEFCTYQLLQQLGNALSIPSIAPNVSSLRIVNIDLASQLFVHLRISVGIALIIGFPYLTCELWAFVVPALYNNERKAAGNAIFWFILLFFLGVAVAYFIIFPMTVNFLGNYQVSQSVANTISLNSYISTFVGLIFTMGVVFELPIVAFFLAKVGVLHSDFLRRYRKVAFVIVLCLAAVITPSTDAFTLAIVALPLWFLYELGGLVVKRVERHTGNT